MSTTQYICIRSWARHTQGEIINEWEWRKLPFEVKDSCFTKVEPVPVTSVKDVAIILANEQPTKPILDNILTNSNTDNNVEVKTTGTEQSTTAKEENDLRLVKRHRFQQNAVGTTNSSGQESVPTVHD